jgi:hypothetical protein
MKECCDHTIITLIFKMIGLWFKRYAISHKLKEIETNYKEENFVLC